MSTLHQVLGGRYEHVHSKATPSVRASVKNLKELCSTMKVESLAESIGTTWYHSQGINQYGPTRSLVERVEPSEDRFPGIDAMFELLMGWEWVFGRTPRFTIRGSFPIPPMLSGQFGTDHGDAVLGVSVACYHGRVESVRLTPLPEDLRLQESVTEALRGVRFVRGDLEAAFSELSGFPDGPLLGFVAHCVCTLVGHAYR